MIITNIYEAKTQLSKLIDKALQGEEVIIGKAGKPVIKLIPYQPAFATRQPGHWRGKVKIAKDFDELPESIRKSFGGE